MQSDPDDPGGDFMQSDPDDPGSGSYPAYGRQDVVGTVHAQPFAGLPVCCCGHEKASGEIPTATGFSQDYSGFVIVRLAADVRPLHFGNLFHLARVLKLTGLLAALEVEVVPPEEAEDQPSADRPERAGPRRREWKRPARWVGPLPSECRQPPDGSEPPAVLEEPEGVLRSAPLVDVPPKGRTATLETIEALESRARPTALRPLHSLKSYWRIDLRPYPERVEEVVEALQRLREVDVAYRELSAVDSGSDSAGEAFSDDQGYLDDAPVGIGARWAWSQLDDPPARILDLEQGWILGHKAFGKTLKEPIYGDNRAADAPELGQHGTAVLGQLVASQMVEGAVPDASFLLASHYKGDEDDDYPFPFTNGHVAAAVVNALAVSVKNPKPLDRGDVLLLEVQRGRFPTEIDPADFDAVRLASALGVIVVEAAGNGNYDLDRIQEPVDGRSFRRGDSRFQDSGAIFVGACLAYLPHDRAPFSNFGSRVDCFAWGESVTTAGYGDLMGDDVPDYYTNTFSGTSSAAPVIAGAVALVQGLHAKQAQTPLRPRPMRALLSNPKTGTRQGPDVGGHIGIMPDLRRVVGGELQVVSQLYLRKRPGDGGASTEADQSLSSSPDVVVSAASLAGPGESQRTFGSSSPTAHDPAPGDPLRPGSDADPRHVFVRLCNRGGGMEELVWVHLFAGPPATLVTPERWSKIGAVKVEGVVQGDTLTVSSGMAWSGAPKGPTLPPELQKAGWSTPSELHSLLAVLPREGVDLAWPVLPPGPPFFQWSTFRKFLRRRGVAWRNAHRVEVPQGPDDLVLACHVAGTPDRERRFDFEVIQRLPEGARVTLAAPTGLAAKLHQRQPWLEKQGSLLTLPQRRSTRFSRVTLAAHAFPELWLRIEDPGGSLGWGHSLAVRQLWRGEEVGRITWHFARAA